MVPYNILNLENYNYNFYDKISDLYKYNIKPSYHTYNILNFKN